MIKKWFLRISAEDGTHVSGHGSEKLLIGKMTGQIGRALNGGELASLATRNYVRVIDDYGRYIDGIYGESATCSHCKKVTLVNTVKEVNKEYKLCGDCYDGYECGSVVLGRRKSRENRY